MEIQMQDLQHNVVNILYMVKGFVEAHLNKTEENVFRDKEEALAHARLAMARIYEQVNRALAITKHIRLAMKPEEEAGAAPAEVSVKEAWAEVVTCLRREYSFESMDVVDRIPNQYPLIPCRRKDLLEIFYTLAQNAVQAMCTTEQYTALGVREKSDSLNAEHCSLTSHKLIIRANLQFANGDYPTAVITISDTGPGIPEAVLSRLFEPFFTTKSPEEGNGLGLCLVRGLVRRNGGRITVSSFENFGTTFTLEFPLGANRSVKNLKPA